MPHLHTPGRNRRPPAGSAILGREPPGRRFGPIYGSRCILVPRLERDDVILVRLQDADGGPTQESSPSLATTLRCRGLRGTGSSRTGSGVGVIVTAGMTEVGAGVGASRCCAGREAPGRCAARPSRSSCWPRVSSPRGPWRVAIALMVSPALTTYICAALRRGRRGRAAAHRAYHRDDQLWPTDNRPSAEIVV